ncbi:MAG: flagellar hook-length control protein FliK [Pirellulaceae bacterium]
MNQIDELADLHVDETMRQATASASDSLVATPAETAAAQNSSAAFDLPVVSSPDPSGPVAIAEITPGEQSLMVDSPVRALQSTPGVAAPAESTPAESIVRQVVNSIESIGQVPEIRQPQPQRVQFQLDPRELGTLAVEISRSDDITRIRIVADLAVAHTILERNVDLLMQSLESSSNQSFDVEVSHQEPGQRDHDDQQQRFADARKRTGDAASQEEAEQTTKHALSSSDASANGLDMVV